MRGVIYRSSSWSGSTERKREPKPRPKQERSDNVRLFIIFESTRETERYVGRWRERERRGEKRNKFYNIYIYIELLHRAAAAGYPEVWASATLRIYL